MSRSLHNIVKFNIGFDCAGRFRTKVTPKNPTPFSETARPSPEMSRVIHNNDPNSPNSLHGLD